MLNATFNSVTVIKIIILMLKDGGAADVTAGHTSFFTLRLLPVECQIKLKDFTERKSLFIIKPAACAAERQKYL